VFLWQKPDRATLERLLASQGAESFSYAAVGATEAEPPADYRLSHNRVSLGRGVDQLRAAKRAIDNWKMFDLPWIELFPPRPSIEIGVTVAVVVRHLGFWSVNVSRLVYVIDEDSRYGFAYGTLHCHAEEGEERFSIEHDPMTDEVWYDLYAFSKPNHPLARIGYPFSRYMQQRFVRESLAAMKRACQNPER
jgi:uncharacterized protein (UPF0548 family)